MNYLIGIAAFLLISAGAWLYGGPKNHAPTNVAELSPGASAWVEVTKPTVTKMDATGATTTLSTGDEVSAGSVISTDAKGTALVHFPDGSFAKLDPGTSLTLSAVDYDETTGASRVHLKLSAGTLWSKVLDLVGVGSSWQVETSNAVATVRGTSFMATSNKGKTIIVGIEHAVAVAALRKDTHEPLPAETSVTANAELTVDDVNLAGLASGSSKLSTTTVSADIVKGAAYAAFIEREKQFDSLRDTLRAQYGDDAQFRKAFREAELKDFKEVILEERSKTTEPVPAIDSSTNGTPVETTSNSATTHTTTAVPTVTQPAPATTPSVSSSGGGSPTTAEAQATSLLVTTDVDLSRGITDGDSISFHAILVYSDGTKKDVTSLAKWNVINKIGEFPSPGRFTADLPADYAELGEVSGAVYATYVGANGKELNGATKAFVIHAYIPPLTNTDG
jgi:hypothetical protein